MVAPGSLHVLHLALSYSRAGFALVASTSGAWDDLKANRDRDTLGLRIYEMGVVLNILYNDG